jgi:hypothetical protein
MKAVLFLLFTIGISMIVFPAVEAAQTRDYLTDDEIELVRDAQQIDDRVAVLTHAIDRRLELLKIEALPPKKESDRWGAMPKGTRLQLLIDVKRILQKAVDDIDNLADRPDSIVVDTAVKKPKGYAELFPKAVRILASAATRYKPELGAELSKTKDTAETSIIMGTMDLCDEISASVTKLPADQTQTTQKTGKKH